MTPYIYRRGEDVKRTPPVPYVFRKQPDPKPARLPDAKDYDPELCGTPRGYRQHHRYRQDACRACKTARNEQQRARLERMKAEAEMIIPNAHSNKNAVRDTPI